MKSLYKRQLIMMVGIVALSFTLLSTAFMLLSYRYIISETRDRLERNAGYIASFTSEYFTSDYYLKTQGTILEEAGEDFYRANVETLTAMSDSSIIVADSNGEIIYASESELYTKKIPQNVVDQIQERGSYTGITTLNGLYSSGRYFAGLPINVKIGDLEISQGLVLVSGDTSGLSEMWRATATIFFFAAVVVLLIAVIASSITSAHQTRPLTEMAEAARKFGRGEFDVRVNNYKDRCDEIGELADAFNSMANSLAKVENQRADFIANVSHELKTPIALIQGYAEGLTEGMAEDEDSRNYYCEVIMDEAGKMNKMVKQLLTLTALEFGNDMPVMERFDITALIRGILASAGILLQQKEARVVFEQKEPVWVWADEFKIEEVITNYLNNAMNHLDGERQITISIFREGDQVRITVFNTGQHIPEEDLDNLWTKFYKVDKARTREYGGSGIGLSIVKAIMDSHNKSCGVENVDGGVEFWFTVDSGV